jgi:hypothetical protein
MQIKGLRHIAPASIAVLRKLARLLQWRTRPDAVHPLAGAA